MNEKHPISVQQEPTPGNDVHSEGAASSGAQREAPLFSISEAGGSSSTQKKQGFWSQFTPEQRSQIMRDRAAIGRANSSKIGRPKGKTRKKAPAEKKQIVKLSTIADRLWNSERRDLAETLAGYRREHLNAIAALEQLIEAIKL